MSTESPLLGRGKGEAIYPNVMISVPSAID